MSCCGDQNLICPCGVFVHPARITNVAGLDAISYRVGDYTTFREALLQALPGEVSLTSAVSQNAGGSSGSTDNSNVIRLWRPGATGDLAVQMIEWWAYLADILTFYNERTATQAYLRTADQSITVNRLVRLLGYRPKPGIGATGTLAALMNGTTTFTLPQGFQIQSKPGPGQPPQIFELKADTVIQNPDVAAIGLIYNSALLSADGCSVLLAGVVSSVKANEQLLLVEQGWNAGNSHYALVTIKGTAPEKDPLGKTNTRVTFQSAVTGLPAGASASDYRLLKSAQSTPLWSYFDTTSELNATSTSGKVELPSVFRQIKVGDPLLVSGQYSLSSRSFELKNGFWKEVLQTTGPYPFQVLTSVSSYSESVWFTNASLSTATTPPDPATKPVVPVLHTTLGFAVPSSPASAQFPGSGHGSFEFVALTTIESNTVSVAFAFQEAGTLMGTPAPTLTLDQPAPSANWVEDSTTGQLRVNLTAAPPAMFPSGSGQSNILLEDASGRGVNGRVSLEATPTNSATLTVTPPNSPPTSLTTPLDVLFNLLPVTRGKTVTNETLGSGNAAIAGQDFILQNKPVTYLADGAGLSGDDYSSTIQLWVNNLKWTEVQNFYGQPPNARVFITKEDEQGRTHVILGDGQNGARPPTGARIVANYRYGSGAAAPAAGSLSVILQPLPGLKAIRNPIQVGGGGDPDPADQVRKYAPRSVLTFGRTVSAGDFEAIAGAAPGVTLAQAVFTLSPASQRPQMRIFVIPGTSGAAQSAKSALSASADPNRVFSVQPAEQIYVKISATLKVAPEADPATVLADATNALASDNNGLFMFDSNSDSPSVYILGVGEAVYDSQIYAALQVSGVQAVENFSFEFRSSSGDSWTKCSRQRHDPPPGNYFALPLSQLHLRTLPSLSLP